MARSLTTVDRHRDRCRGASGEGPAAFRRSRRAQPNLGEAGDVAEAIFGVEAPLRVGADDERRAPTAGRPLEVLDRDDLAAAGDPGRAEEDAAVEAHRFAGVELARFGREADRGADPQRERAPGRGPEPAAAVEGDLDAARGPGREPQLEAPATLGDDATTFRSAPDPSRAPDDDCH